ncbi:MAG: hypothetical protein KatS3mg076_1762 [Candidatus Binatia bacterium]|nr:MAG: hypothetical protein KatS3mg076_1762 [Candidatus Binatia bacterium]
MSQYLLIESRDPFEWNDVRYFYALARDLAAAGHAVTLYLVQNGVLPARREAKCDELRRVVEAGVEVLAEEFSLRERGIPADCLLPGVRTAPLEVVIDRLAEGHKALWH